MLISAFAAIVMFAAPEAAQDAAATTEAPAAAAAPAKPLTKRVCETIQVAGSNLPKKKCREVPVKAEAKEEAKAETAKSE